MKCSMRIYLKISEKFEKLQKTGSRFTTKKDLTVPLAEYRLETIEHRQKTQLFKCTNLRGYYRITILLNNLRYDNI